MTQPTKAQARALRRIEREADTLEWEVVPFPVPGFVDDGPLVVLSTTHAYLIEASKHVAWEQLPEPTRTLRRDFENRALAGGIMMSDGSCWPNFKIRLNA